MDPSKFLKDIMRVPVHLLHTHLLLHLHLHLLHLFSDAGACLVHHCLGSSSWRQPYLSYLQSPHSRSGTEYRDTTSTRRRGRARPINRNRKLTHKTREPKNISRNSNKENPSQSPCLEPQKKMGMCLNLRRAGHDLRATKIKQNTRFVSYST